jgi:iron complex outermembrane receptor protein
LFTIEHVRLEVKRRETSIAGAEPIGQARFQIAATVDTLSFVETNNVGTATGSPQGTGHARWRATAMMAIEPFDNFRVTVTERYRGPLNWFHTQKSSALANAQQFTLLNAPANIQAKWHTNLNFAYDLGPAELFVNVQNLFNTAPAIYANPNAPFAGLNGVAPGDDLIGRYFVTGLRLKF